MTSRSVQRVVDRAAERGLTIDVREFPDGTKTALDAANAVDCTVDQIVKSMVFDASGEIVLALTSGTHQVDPDALAEVNKCSASCCGDEGILVKKFERQAGLLD